MKIIGIILLVILGLTMLAVLTILLYMFWFKAIPEFWEMIKNKIED